MTYKVSISAHMLATNVIHFTRIFAMPGYYWARAKPPFALSVAKGLMQVRPFAIAQGERIRVGQTLRCAQGERLRVV